MRTPRPLAPLAVLVTALFTVLLGLASPAVSAPAADPAKVKECRERALAAVQSDADGLERARVLAELAALDDTDSAKGFCECIAAIGIRQGQLEALHQQTKKEYEPFAGFTMKEPSDWAKKRKLLDQLDAEEERIQSLGVLVQASITSIVKLKDPGALGVAEKCANGESDPRARHMLMTGLLSNTAFTKAADLAKKALKDDAPLVRMGAYEALGVRKDASLLELLAVGLKEQGWPARAITVRALEQIADVRAVPFLVAAMQTDTGAILDDYARALRTLTGENHGHFPDVWARWYEAHKDDLAQKGAKPTVAKPGKPPATTNYYGVETPSKRVLFVIDVSGSMKEPIGDETEVTGVSKSQQLTGPKIEVAKNVLTDAVHKLDKSTKFNIVFFNHEVRVFQEQMVLATDEVKAKADLAIQELGPSGSTWAYGALRKAFEFAGVSGEPLSGKFDPQVDTIFFLSDGAPTDDAIDEPKLMEPKEILDAVKEWNRLARIRIHTIAIDPRIGKGAFVRFMKGLAADNHGTYTEIGAK